ncbi:ATP:guanido phosphotransferase, catalytic domain protein [Teladorsagia circumcincta]|uniref:arginine kinase n=1 Tax=Teladorsagia circumcincta TaxID=45464 RepID=A0A2G9V0D3_TELCI|nr:ATP:guanido phosphotransferase, catalytic domain protein [Teladorsagia circumcincta]
MTASPDVVKKIEEGYAKLQAAADCKSLLKKHLTKVVLDKLKRKKTRLGATLLDVIQSGVENLDSGVGLYAPDAEAYTLFADLFNPVIEDYHGGFKATDTQPPMDLGEKNINYKNMEKRMQDIFTSIKDDELKGTYYPLTGMDEETKKKLIADHFLFKEGDRFLQAANANRFWPTGRGIFHNEAKTFLVWVNEEDHLRIISMQPGGDVGAVLGRLIKGVTYISTKAPFARHPRLGWLTFCPTNLGTTVRASVHIKLPKTSAKPEFKQICADMKLQIRGIHGEHSESAEGIYDISNKQRLGLTEYEAVRQMYDGVKKLIEMETAAG